MTERLRIASRGPLRSPRLLTSLVLISVLLVAACGGGGDESGAAGAATQRSEREDRSAGADAEQSADEQEAQQAPAEQAQADAAGAPVTVPQHVGVLRIAEGEPITLDPALTTDANSAFYVVEIFGGLLTLIEGATSLEIAPDLAEAMPEPIFNDDGTLTYRFVLRRDALFHNGTRVTAEDVKWSLERHLARETFSPTAIDFLGDIVGARDYNRGRADDISGIVVVDERTIDITIDAPRPYFLFKLTYPTAYVVDRTQVEADPTNWTRNPNGTGPFQLREWNLGEGLILQRFDRYHLGPARVDTVQVRFAGGGLTQYENDEVDIAGVGVNDIERARDPASDINAEFVVRNELSVFYIGFNTSQPPFDDADVRRALALAIDKQTLVEVVLMDALQSADGILPPGLAAHDPNYRGLQFDPELAQELVAGSSYAGSPILESIRLTISGAGATPGAVIEAVQQMWLDNLGLEIEIQQVEAANFFSELDRGLYQMFNIGWILDYPDPENVLDLKFHSRSLLNDVSLRDDEVDAMLEEARLELDPVKRVDLYRQVERLLVERAVWIPLFYGQQNRVVKPYVEGYVPPASVIPHLRFIAVGQ